MRILIRNSRYTSGKHLYLAHDDGRVDDVAVGPGYPDDVAIRKRVCAVRSVLCVMKVLALLNKDIVI